MIVHGTTVSWYNITHVVSQYQQITQLGLYIHLHPNHIQTLTWGFTWTLDLKLNSNMVELICLQNTVWCSNLPSISTSLLSRKLHIPLHPAASFCVRKCFYIISSCERSYISSLLLLHHTVGTKLTSSWMISFPPESPPTQQTQSFRAPEVQQKYFNTNNLKYHSIHEMRLLVFYWITALWTHRSKFIHLEMRLAHPRRNA